MAYLTSLPADQLSALAARWEMGPPIFRLVDELVALLYGSSLLPSYSVSFQPGRAHYEEDLALVRSVHGLFQRVPPSASAPGPPAAVASDPASAPVAAAAASAVPPFASQAVPGSPMSTESDSPPASPVPVTTPPLSIP